MKLEKLLRKKMRGYDENGECKNAVIERLRRYISKDGVSKFAILIEKR